MYSSVIEHLHIEVPIIINYLLLFLLKTRAGYQFLLMLCVKVGYVTYIHQGSKGVVVAKCYKTGALGGGGGAGGSVG